MNPALRRSTRAIALALVCVSLATGLSGCFGRFALTRKLYGLNQSISDKWLRTIVTFVLVVVPVYGLCAVVDWALFNTIEFWGGTNPIDGVNSDLPPPVAPAGVTTAGNRAIEAQFSPDGNELRVALGDPGSLPRVLSMKLRDDGAELRDGQGQLIATLTRDAAGNTQVRDGRGLLLDERGAAETGQLEAAIAAGDRARLLEFEARGARVARR